jgi:hypothetical protein
MNLDGRGMITKLLGSIVPEIGGIYQTRALSDCMLVLFKVFPDPPHTLPENEFDEASHKFA